MKPTNPKLDQYWHNPGPCGLITRTALRTLQFTLAIITAALYGIDLAHSTTTSTPANSEWIYAEIVAALSAITCIVHCFVTVTRVGWCTWDFVLFVLWMAQTGVFGNIYVRRDGDVEGDYVRATGSLGRMRAGVWVGLVCMVLWLGTFVLAVGWCCRTRKVVRRTDKDKEQEQEQEKVGDEERGVIYAENETDYMSEGDWDSIKKAEKGEKGAKY